MIGGLIRDWLEKQMSIKRVEPGRRMSQAVVHNGVVYLAGQVADKAAGASIRAQTSDILGQIDALLASAGTDKGRVLSATIYLVDINTFAEMNEVWDAWVSPGSTPARACVEARLAAPKYGVEISLIVASGA
jgi:enamine deaminase RidA (YjgF/YER057c/UK114 family)